MAYVTVNDIEGRCAGLMPAIDPINKIFGPTTIPTLAQVTQYITDIEGELDGYFTAIGLSTPFSSGSNAEKRIRPVVISAVTGYVYSAFSRASGDNGDVDGEDMLKDYRMYLKDIKNNPDFYLRMFGSVVSNAKYHGDQETIRDPFIKIASRPLDF